MTASIDPRDLLALRVPCPVCSAPIGVPCHPAAYPDQAVAPHLARVDAARALDGSVDEMVAAQLSYVRRLDNPRLSETRRAWAIDMARLLSDAIRMAVTPATDGDA